MERMFYGPLWPLGYVQIDYRGAGEAITSNLASLFETTEYFEAAAKGLIISPARKNGSVFANNTGYIFLCLKSPVGTFDAETYPDTVVMAIAPTAGVVQFPQAEYGDNRYKMNDLGIDSDVDNDGAFICALMQ